MSMMPGLRLSLLFLFLLPAAFLPRPGFAGSHDPVPLRWKPTPEQVRTWTSGGGNGLFRKDPQVSLKAALPDESEPTLVIFEERWGSCLCSEPAEVRQPTAEIGLRSEWRGIPFTEVLLHPRRPGPAPGTCEILLFFRGELRRSDTAGDGPLQNQGAQSPWARCFVNPADANRLMRRDRPPPRVTGVRAFPANPVTALFRLDVSADGIYEMDFTWLQNGAETGLDDFSFDLDNLHLTCLGVEIPILVEDADHSGTWTSGDSILFYGQALTEALSYEPRDYFNAGDYTDTNVYWLYADESPGLRMDAVPRNADPLSGYGEAVQVQAAIHAETQEYFYCIGHVRPREDLWYWLPFYGSAASPSADYAFDAPFPASSEATISATVLAFNDTAHGVRARLNGAAPSTGSEPAGWSGVSLLQDETWTFSTGLLDGANTFSLIAEETDPADWQILDEIDVTYTRTLETDTDALFFEDPSVDATYRPFGFSLQPILLDLSTTDGTTGLFLPELYEVSPAYFTDSGDGNPDPDQLSFEMAGAAGTRRLALSAAPLIPDGMHVSTGRDLTDSALSAGLVILTHPDFHPSGSDAVWQSYLARRQGAMDVEVVDIQDVFDNFSFGIYDPLAIRAFLQTTESNWSAAPEYVLMIGDGTFDYHDYYGKGYRPRVPNMMREDLSDNMYYGRFCTDAWLADTGGDGYPDMAAGRIPVRTYAELEGVLQKIMDYEDAVLSGDWYKSILYVADDGFKADNEALAATYTPSPWISQLINYEDPPYNGTNADLCAEDIRSGLAQSAFLRYNGHGGTRTWGYTSPRIFSANLDRNGGTQSDLDILCETSHGPRYPMILNSNCYTSAFEQTNAPCMMEDGIIRPGCGPVATYGPTSISYVTTNNQITDAMFDQLFGLGKARCIGDVCEASRFAIPSTNGRGVFSMVLLGDPTLELRLPAPEAPSDLNAVPGHESASLTWDAPAEAPDSYNVYRSQNGGSSWTFAGNAANPWFDDSGLTNMVEYWYRIVSVDAEGFEGPPCPSTSVVPENPNPPSVPTGLSVTDPGLTDRLSVSWTANPEGDLSGYTLRYGTETGVYTEVLTFGKAFTAATVAGLTEGQPYYFVLTATNTSNKESGYSGEEAGTPTGLMMAIRPPRRIDDLQVSVSDDDLVLDWTKPTVDDAGQAVTVSGYEIYRVQGVYDWTLDSFGSPPYSPDDALIAVGDPDQTTYVDTGAFLLPDPLTYLVVALDANGDRSSASHPPPVAIRNLTVASSPTPGRTLLQFGPVSLTVEGGSTIVASYRLYGFHPAAASSDHIAPPDYVFLAEIDPADVATPPCEGAVYCDDSGTVPLFYTVVAVDNRGNTGLY